MGVSFIKCFEARPLGFTKPTVTSSLSGKIHSYAPLSIHSLTCKGNVGKSISTELIIGTTVRLTAVCPFMGSTGKLENLSSDNSDMIVVEKKGPLR